MTFPSRNKLSYSGKNLNHQAVYYTTSGIVKSAISMKKTDCLMVVIAFALLFGRG